jgi:hypothetical protein
MWVTAQLWCVRLAIRLRQRWFERRGATRQHGMRVLELDVARRLIIQADAQTNGVLSFPIFSPKSHITTVTTVTTSVLLRS